MLTESRPIQETLSQDSQLQDIQPIAVREPRPHQKREFSTARRYGVYIDSPSDDDRPGPQQSASMWSLEEVQEPQQVGNEASDPKEDSGFQDSDSPNTTLAREFWKYAHSEDARRSWGERTLEGMISHFLQMNKAERLSSEECADCAGERDGTQGHLRMRVSRSVSNASNVSVRSSGYYSMRNSKVEEEPLVSEPTPPLGVPEESQSHVRFTALSPVSESFSSQRSSCDDSPDDDFHSCTSLESQNSEGEVIHTCCTLQFLYGNCVGWCFLAVYR